MKKYNPLISDEKEVSDLEAKFNQAEAIINQRIYNSQIDEKNRIIRLKTSRVFKGELIEVSKMIKKFVLQDMHPDLNPEQISQGSYFFASNKANKVPVKVIQLNDQAIAILWYGFDGTKYQKTLLFRQINPKHVKVTYYDFVKGLKTIYGLHDTHFKQLYLRKQNLVFEIEMNKVAIELADNEKLKNKLLARNERYQKKIENKY